MLGTVLRRWTAIGTLLVGCAVPALAQLRVANYNIAGITGDPAALQRVFGEIMADDKPGWAVAPAIFVFSEVHTGNVTSLRNALNLVAPPGVTYAQATYTNAGEDSASGAEGLYYRTDLISEDVSGHIDLSTGGSRNTDRWKLQLVGYSSPAATLYVYCGHLKASTGSSNESARTAGMTTIRHNADGLGPGVHILYCGDWNVYNNAEGAYQEVISAGNGQAFDPYGNGNWTTATNAWKHTQSPYGGTGSLTTGGMDDRFDFQLGTAAMNDGAGLAYITGTYRPFGNDGNHYNLALNVGTSSYYPADIPRSTAIADDLAIASDHCPVLADYQTPAVMSATLAPAEFGRVIVGAPLTATLSVSNTAVVQVAIGADVLSYAAAASGDLSGSASGSVPALSPAATAEFALDTTTTGIKSGSVLVTTSSQAAQNPSLTRSTAATVIRHGNPSFSDSADIDTTTLSDSGAPNSGTHALSAAVYNFGYDSGQALLNVTGVSGVTAPFAFVGGTQDGIGATPATLALNVDTTGLAPGVYTDDVTVSTSDEALPGATVGSLALTLQFTVAAAYPVGDMNCDGLVNNGDIDAFVLALTDSQGYAAQYPGCPTSNADINQDGLVNNGDIDAFVALLTGG